MSSWPSSMKGKKGRLTRSLRENDSAGLHVNNRKRHLLIIQLLLLLFKAAWLVQEEMGRNLHDGQKIWEP